MAEKTGTPTDDGPSGMPLPPKREAWPLVMVGCVVLVMLGLASVAFLGVRTVFGGVRGGGALTTRAGCTGNLMQISAGLQMYAADHGGAFPAELSALVPAYLAHHGIFVCPGDRSGITPGQLRGGGLSNTNSSYEYLPGRDPSLPGDFVLAFDRSTENHGREGFNVLFCDGQVEWWPAARLKELNERIDAQEVAVESARISPDKREEILGEYRKKHP